MAAQDYQPRQAVVVIHGIGEQRPMQTLRAFVTALLQGDSDSFGEPRFFSKPDRLTETLELRRLATWPPHVAVQTDFYELYWAHLMQGTLWSHVFAWARMLMLRVPRKTNRVIQGLWLGSWLALLAAVFIVLRSPPPADLPKLFTYGVLGVLAYVVLRLFGFFGLRFLGDAARYLSPLPENIEARKNIRNATIGLLTKLHEEQPARYDRIIVVGHSLGSVIAYDALTHLWQARHSKLPPPQDSPQQPQLEQARRLGIRLVKHPAPQSPPKKRRDQDCLERWRRRQRRLWSEQLDVGIDWRITDLVTLGSPLALCTFLLARNEGEWKEMKRQRECPTSPPQLEDDRDTGRLRISFPHAPHSGVQILHHAALFACTRWTNLYFAADPVGGPVGGADRFGAGIKDVPVPASRWWSRWTPVAHVCYWSASEPSARDALLGALNLAEGPGPVADTDKAEPDPERLFRRLHRQKLRMAMSSDDPKAHSPQRRDAAL